MSLTTVVAASEAGTVVTFTEAGTFITVTESGTVIRPEQIRLQTIGGALAGPRGLSAYQLAVQEGFNGTLDEWLDTLKGDPATNYISSVFGRVGAITPQAGDYTPAQVGADPAGAAAAALADANDYTDGKVADQSALDRQYTDGAVAAILESAPAQLDTLNELAMALGDDPNFAATMAAALGYRLRIDTALQGLTAEQKTNAYANLGLGTIVTYNVADFASSSAFSSLSGIVTGQGEDIAALDLRVDALEAPPAVRTVAVSGAVLATDAHVTVEGAGVVLTLPPAASAPGKTIRFKCATDSTFKILPDGADLIDGNMELTILFRNTSLELTSDGDNWLIG